MKSLLTLTCAALLLAVLPASAQETKPNTLTPQEISAGWILLFDGETSFGWSPRGDAKWEVKDGLISAVKDSGKGYLTTTTEFPNYHLHAEFWIDDVANSGIMLRCPTTGMIDGENSYEVNIYDAHKQWPTGSINNIVKVKGKPKTTGKWNSYDITAEGNHLQVVLNGKRVTDIQNGAHARGQIALQYNGEGMVRFRNVKLQPLSLGSIFNGKDLSGWKVFPGRKSTFSVTPEGWINVKNGPGDLQTKALYGDFVLQLDCISNGPHLNSGIFYRAIPDEYQNGYECQIRNEWMGDDRTKPVDFGTGAIYRRQPARKVVSSDHEWFTMTLIANGPHMTAWVNGYQVSDFTDTRPMAENPRNGVRTKPGAISIQGHDPTTDLSFRNIRISEMPASRS